MIFGSGGLNRAGIANNSRHPSGAEIGCLLITFVQGQPALLCGDTFTCTSNSG